MDSCNHGNTMNVDWKRIRKSTSSATIWSPFEQKKKFMKKGWIHLSIKTTKTGFCVCVRRILIRNRVYVLAVNLNYSFDFPDLTEVKGKEFSLEINYTVILNRRPHEKNKWFSSMYCIGILKDSLTLYMIAKWTHEGMLKRLFPCTQRLILVVWTVLFIRLNCWESSWPLYTSDAPTM